MRKICLLCVILFSFSAISCQQKNTAIDDQPAPATAVIKGEQESLPPFEDTEALFNGRSLLITHMTQVENLAVPQVDDWEPVRSYLEDEWQVYQYRNRSGGWSLTLAKLQAEADPTMFRARVTGPSDFNYAADIFGEGTVFPAQ